MGKMEDGLEEPLYIKTPLIESIPLSKRCGLNVYLKLENTQPPGSFKLRGLSNHCIQARTYTLFKCPIRGEIVTMNLIKFTFNLLCIF